MQLCGLDERLGGRLARPTAVRCVWMLARWIRGFLRITCKEILPVLPHDNYACLSRRKLTTSSPGSPMKIDPSDRSIGSIGVSRQRSERASLVCLTD